MALRLSWLCPFIFERMSTYGYRQHPQNSFKTFEKKARYTQQSQILERHLMKNLESLDDKTRRLAFGNLFGYYISSGQWIKLVRMSLVDDQALISLVTIPRRMNSLR